MQFSSFRTIGKLMLFTRYLSSIELMSQANWIFILGKRARKETCFVYIISSKNGNSAVLRLFKWLNRCALHSIIYVQLCLAPWKIYRPTSLTHMLVISVCVEVIDGEIIILNSVCKINSDLWPYRKCNQSTKTAAKCTFLFGVEGRIYKCC